jgi:23S rRNA (pseudouridine1915-N3)-methyltransferase
MEVRVLSVGTPGAAWRELVTAYERRAGRYFRLNRITVREEPARGRSPEEIRERECGRLLQRAGSGLEIVALTRAGELWSSERLAQYLDRLMTQARPGTAFLIGGALGLGSEALAAGPQLSLSRMTLPHELALVFLLEQLYRAGTILRGEPYHKGPGAGKRGG